MIPIWIYMFIRWIAVEALLCYWTYKLNKKRKWSDEYEFWYILCLIWSIVWLFLLWLAFVKQ